MRNIHKYRRKIKRKTIKSKSEYASGASPNSPLNIYVADMHESSICRLFVRNVVAPYIHRYLNFATIFYTV